MPGTFVAARTGGAPVMTRTTGGSEEKDGARNRPSRGVHRAQSEALPSDVFDAVTDALADALIADYKAELGEKPAKPVQPNANGFTSRRGNNHAA